jgi:hypothetical protein
MTDLERYRCGLDHCKKKAEESPTQEIRELWLSIVAAYGFLLEREQRTTPAA